MKSINQLINLLLCILFCAAATLAQAPTKTAISQDVTIIIQQEQVRFTSQKPIQMMQLQIANQSGEQVYDSGPMTVAEINWTLQTANGEAIKSGLYAYTLSIYESGAATARVRRGHFIVDRAQDRDGKTDKLWVTSQQGSDIGTELTVARNEDSTVAGTSTTNNRTSATSRDTASREVAGKTDAKTPAVNDVPKLEAASGTVGQIAKFTSGADLGNSVMTEANGNIGIGITAPSYKLDVAGNLRAARNTSNDIAVQTTGGTNAWAQFRMQTPSQQWGLGTSQNFNGNQFYLFDGTYNQTRFTIQPNGGEVAFPSPVSNHVAIRTSGGTNSWAQLRMQTTNQSWMLGTSQNFNGDQLYLVDLTRNQQRMTIQPNGGAIAFPSGNFGIGTANPATKLHVEGGGPVEATIKSGNDRAILVLDNGLGASRIVWTVESGGAGMPGWFGIYNRTTRKAGLEINGDLLVSVKALQITGGADFAENFDVSNENHAASEIQPGMVVAIDPTNPGKLNLSRRAYDRRVAGIISGAGGVNPGMRMGQAGTLADGQHPVALSGRVYCWVDGAVKAGDLLTTSTTPGYAMKATNRAKAQGAILGKAMTSQKEGKGLVLVLVTLQ